MKKYKKLILFSLIIFFFVPSNAQKKLPNIIIIYVDDMGYGDLQSYGSEIATPNMDMIGKNGVRFTDFYVAAPVCTPSRYALLTGNYPQRSKHNLTFALMPDDKNYLDVTETTIAGYLKNIGYQTNIIGKWHLGLPAGSLPTIYGFDSFTGSTEGCIDYFTHSYGTRGTDWFVNNQVSDEKGYSTDLITNHAIDYVNAQSSKTAPFFLYLPYNAPHYGKTNPDKIQDYTISLGKVVYHGVTDLNTLQAPPKYINRYSFIKDPYRRAYAAMVSSLDDNIGRLMKTLSEKKILENTMIWFISDNGGYAVSNFSHASNGNLRGEKASLFEGGIRVPAMVYWKNKIKAGQIDHSVTSNLDVLPTLMAITGAVPLEKLQADGLDISPLLLNNQPLPPRVLYWKFRDSEAIRKGDWKLIHDRYGLQLFDLKSDATEQHNLVEVHPDIVSELKQIMITKEIKKE